MTETNDKNSELSSPNEKFGAELAERKVIKAWMIWVILFMSSFLFYPSALTSSWVSNSDLHSLLEFWAATIALIAAAIVLIHFFATGRRFFLLISLGFTLQGAEDLVHAIYSFSRIWPAEQVGIVDLILGTYVSGRLILIACLLLALYLEKKASIAENKVKEVVIYNSVGFLLVAIVTAIVINSPLPRFIILSGQITRPIDFMAAIVYLVAFFLFVRVYHDKEHHTPFMCCMIGSIIFGFAAQVHIVHSQQLYDAQFAIAHVLKIISYTLPIFGIAVGTLTMYKKEEKLAWEIQIKNNDLGERVKELGCLYGLSRIVEKPNISLDGIFQEMMNLIPSAWHYPEVTRARIYFDGAEYLSEPFEKTQWRQTSDIVVSGKQRGSVEVYYTEERPVLDEGPFLQEERNLIDGIARTVSEAAERKQNEEKLRKVHEKLVLASHRAGMAEVATDVLHNVGNILNSINVSVNFIENKVLNSKITNLKKVADMIAEHADDLGTFLTEDQRGRHIPVYLTEAARLIADEQADITKKLQSLNKNVDHLEEIIRAQQAYARGGGVKVYANINDVIKDAIEINSVGLERHGAKFSLELTELPEVFIDKQSVLQILVNLVSNGKYALSESENQEKLLTIRCYKHGEDRLRIEVVDNGMGIPRENLTKVFRHGFTTKKDGHGFGLHSSALAAKEMHGFLTVHSDGPGHGATFILDLPFEPGEVTQCIP